MKFIKPLLLAAFIVTVGNTGAQTSVPGGYVKGSVVLADGSVINGFVKENFRKSASVSFIKEAGDKKISYDGFTVSSVDVNGTKYISAGGDFFKTLCEDKLTLVQKASDASGIVIYNGSDASISSGTEGKPGDFFTYDNNTRKLNLIAPQQIKDVVNASFPGCKGVVENTGNVNAVKAAGSK
jgi:hypothetical protein